jgi:hypothetical protein
MEPVRAVDGMGDPINGDQIFVEATQNLALSAAASAPSMGSREDQNPSRMKSPVPATMIRSRFRALSSGKRAKTIAAMMPRCTASAGS